MIRERRASQSGGVSPKDEIAIVESPDIHAVRGRVWELLGLPRVPGMRYELSRDQVVPARHGLNDPHVCRVRQALGDMNAPVEEFTVTFDGWFVYSVAHVASTVAVGSDGEALHRAAVQCWQLTDEDL